MLPYLHQPFEIETDVSDYALDAVITQLGHPVVFHSDTFSDTIIRYSILQAIKQWGHYILGREMVILNDHNTLYFSPSQSKLQTTRQIEWINYLYQF